MPEKKKKLILYSAVGLLAVLLFCGTLWYMVPYRSYQAYEAAMPAEIDTEITYPTVFRWRGRIRMFVNAYSALEIVPGVFGGSELYAVFAGMSEDYRIPVDGDLIPLGVINEECEILLDESRETMKEYLAWALDNWDLE